MGLRVCFSVIPSFYRGRVGNQLRHPRTPCVPIRCWRLWQNIPKWPLLGPWHLSNEHQLEISQCGDLLSFYTAGMHCFHCDETELFFKHITYTEIWKRPLSCLEMFSQGESFLYCRAFVWLNKLTVFPNNLIWWFIEHLVNCFLISEWDNETLSCAEIHSVGNKGKFHSD